MSITSPFTWVAVFGLSVLGGTLPVAAADKSALTFTFENDVLTGSDNNYTNGFGLSYVSGEVRLSDEDTFIRKWSDFWTILPFIGDEGYATYAAWTVAQEMHTPDEITASDPPMDDQPYAGVLYIDSMLYARKDRWAHMWQLKLGVVGPASQADDLQSAVHDLMDVDKPMGWHSQLPDEPVVNIGYTAAYLTGSGRLGSSAKWRVTSLGTVGLGNYFTGAGVGVIGEVGWNLVDAFGGAALRSGLNVASTVGVGRVDDWSVSFFGGLGGYGVAHYLPLDGTVFRKSRSVGSEPFIGTGSVGLCIRHHRLVLSFAATFFSDTFGNQRQGAEFGTFSVSWAL